tara:strand:+ start:1712 stop:1924 length:213 start_codon:yes stop_codon:yes gene_type:complete
MQQQPENIINIDGFTYHVEHMSPDQQKHANDIRRADFYVDQNRFMNHVLEFYKQKLLDELAEMLKADGKK